MTGAGYAWRYSTDQDTRFHPACATSQTRPSLASRPRMRLPCPTTYPSIIGYKLPIFRQSTRFRLDFATGLVFWIMAQRADCPPVQAFSMQYGQRMTQGRRATGHGKCLGWARTSPAPRWGRWASWTRHTVARTVGVKMMPMGTAERRRRPWRVSMEDARMTMMLPAAAVRITPFSPATVRANTIFRRSSQFFPATPRYVSLLPTG